jgi:hypothetical protein
MTAAAVHAFDADTAITPAGPGRWTAETADHWIIQSGGPNGGFLGALAVRAAEAAAGRPLRTIQISYLAAPVAGTLDVSATVERAGRSVSFVSVRIEQAGRPMTLALCVLGELATTGGAWDLAPAPEVAPVVAAPRGRNDDPEIPPFVRNYEMHRAIGPALADWSPGAAGAEPTPPVVGGWIRTAEPRALDAPLVVAMLDSWAPSAWVAHGGIAPTPTLDLTVHVRRALPAPGMAPEDHALVEFRTSLAVGGMWEEDGRLWSHDGVLLAHSRQLALLREPRG